MEERETEEAICPAVTQNMKNAEGDAWPDGRKCFADREEKERWFWYRGRTAGFASRSGNFPDSEAFREAKGERGEVPE